MKHYFNWLLATILYYSSDITYRLSGKIADLAQFFYDLSFKFARKDGFLSEIREHLENTIEEGSGCVFCDLGLKPDSNGWHEGNDKNEKAKCPNFAIMDLLIKGCPSCGDEEAQEKFGKCFYHR